MPRTTDLTRKKRKEARAQFLDLANSGQDGPANVAFPDESWFENHPRARNAQNQRTHVRPSDDPAAAHESLLKPARQRSAGIMVFMAISASGGGFATRIRFVPPGVKVTQECYLNLPRGDISPQIRASTPQFTRTQDAAPAHGAKATISALQQAVKDGGCGRLANFRPP